MKILVTGANGQVGTELCRLQSNHQIIGLGHGELDITNATQVKASLRQHQPDVVVNASAYTAVDKAEEESELAFAVNLEGANNLALACHDYGIPLIHLSTDYVFSGDTQAPYKEDDQAGPINVYGQSKWQGEEAVRQHCPRHIILRTSWVFGRYGNNFVKTMLRVGQQRDELSVVNDQFGCPTAAHHIAEGILKIIDTLQSQADEVEQAWGNYHLAGTPPTNWYEFARAIFKTAEAFGYTPPVVKAIPTSAYPTPACRPCSTVLDVNKLHLVFGFAPPSWQEGLKTVLESVLKS